MLVSSIGETLKDETAFIKTGLEEAGYTVSDCVNIIGRPDVLENAKNYDTAIVFEKKYKSSNNLLVQENSVIKEYITDCSYIVLF